MGALLQRAIDVLVGGNKEQRILMLGLDAAGKTSIVYKLKLGETIHTVPTIGFNVEKIQYKKLSMTLWDVGGQTKIRQLWRHYTEGSNALIYVIDSSDLDRFEEAKENLHALFEQTCLNQVPVLIFANKSDCGVLSAEKISQKLDLQKLNLDWHVQPCCALNGDGLYEGLEWLNRQLKK